MISSAHLQSVGTARLQSINEGVLQAALAIRSIPQGVYCPTLRNFGNELIDALDKINAELKARQRFSTDRCA